MKRRGEAYHSILIYSINEHKLFNGRRKNTFGYDIKLIDGVQEAYNSRAKAKTRPQGQGILALKRKIGYESSEVMDTTSKMCKPQIDEEHEDDHMNTTD